MHKTTEFMLYIFLLRITFNCSAICQPYNPNTLSDSNSHYEFNKKTKVRESVNATEKITHRKASDAPITYDMAFYIRHRRKRTTEDDQVNCTVSQTESGEDRMDGMRPNKPNKPTFMSRLKDCPLTINSSVYFSAANTMNFEHYMRFWETSVCGDSCLVEPGNVLQNSTIYSAHSCGGCFCDGCRVYGDCCLDKALDGATLNNPLLEYTSCTTPTQGFNDGGEKGAYIFVTKCPVDYNNDIVRRNCENRSAQFETVLNNPPVYNFKSKTNYLNSYCAECHGDLDDLTEWTSQINCTEAIRLSSIRNMQDVINLINTNDCSMFDPPKDSLSRLCQLNVSDIINECNVTGDLISFNTDLEKPCGMYSNPLTVDNQMYQNVFCALCNGKESSVITKWDILKELSQAHHKVNEDLSSPNSAPRVPSFSIIFNLRPRQKSPKKLDDNICPEDSILIHTGSCRKLACSAGRILLSHSCEDAFKTAKGLGFGLSYQLWSTDRATFFKIRDIDSFGAAYLAHLEHQYNDFVVSLQPLFFKMTMDICYKPSIIKDIASIERVTSNITAVIGGDVSQRRAEITLLRFFESEWEFSNIFWKVEAIVSKEMPMSDREFECRHFEYGILGDLSEDYSLNEDLVIPLTPMSRCNQTELSAEEYSLNHTTGLLKTNVTDIEYKAGEYIIDEDRVRICINATNHETHTGIQEDRQFQINMQWVTTISMSVSISCLCLTIAVCVVTKTRQTLPGKITIALVTTLTIAQLLFVTSGQVYGNLWGCRFVGMAIHYSWLTAFSWKHVAGYHMYVSFVHPFRKSSGNWITFVRYSSYAFGTPLAIVVGYTATHIIMSNKKNIGYGDHACFLSSAVDIGVAFALPVSIVIVSNSFFFGRVVHVIRKMSKLEKHSNRANANHSIIFMKMSLLLGFTWVVGFLANMGDNQIMWYTFVALNTGIGVFIFLGQVWNKRVIGQIRKAMGLDHTSESLTSKTNSKSL